MDKIASKLYNSFEKDRDNIADTLNETNDYHVLMEIIKCIQEKYPNENEIWYKLCVGLKGDDANKFSAIYEIPTKQLIDCLAIIFQIYNINKIDEVGAGVGLLTALLQKKFDVDGYNVKLVASDNCSSDCTNISLDFTTIIKKDISDIVLQHNKNLNPPDAVICCWPIEPMMEQIHDLIKSKHVKIIVIITDVRQKSILPKKSNIELEEYRIFDLPIYQCSYLDVYENNKVDGLYSRSKTFVLIRKDLNDINLNDILSGALYEKKEINNDKINVKINVKIKLLDLATLKRIPYWMCELKTNEELNTANKIFELIKINIKFLKKEIPLWIPNLDLLIFWYIRKNKKMFPLKIKTTEKLIEYKEMITNMNPEKIKKYKDNNILPSWIQSNYIDMYFWLMFSVPENDDQKWKDNITEFNHKFNQVYGYRAGPSMSFMSSFFENNSNNLLFTDFIPTNFV